MSEVIRFKPWVRPRHFRLRSLASLCVLALALASVSATDADARRRRRKKARPPPPVEVEAVEETRPSEEAEPDPVVPATPVDCAEPKAEKRVVRVLVLDLEAGRASLKPLAASLAAVVAREAKRVSGYEIITNAEIRSALDQEASKQLIGCDDTSCLAEVAEALDADLLVSGRVDIAIADTVSSSEDGETKELEVAAPLISLSLLNTRAIVTVNRVTLTWPGDPELLVDVAKAATQLLMFEKKDRPPGALTVDGAPPGSQVLVDGVDATEDALMGTIGGLDVGPHVVRVLASGFKSKTTHVLVQSKETSRVDGTLEPQGGISQIWIWTGVGVAVVAGAGLTALVVAATTQAPVTVAIEPKVPRFEDLQGAR